MTEQLAFVHRWIPGGVPDAPVMLMLHGTGGDESDLIPLGNAIAPGAAILSPRGQVLEHGMPRFFRRLAEGVLDVPDLVRRAGELAEFVVAASERYAFDVRRVTAVGFSNGANVAAGLMLVRPGVLPAAALLRPMVPFEPEGAADRTSLAGTRVLVLGGDTDPVVPRGHPARLAEILRARGAEVEVAMQPGGHQLAQGDVAALRTWLGARRLGA